MLGKKRCGTLAKAGGQDLGDLTRAHYFVNPDLNSVEKLATSLGYQFLKLWGQ